MKRYELWWIDTDNNLGYRYFDIYQDAKEAFQYLKGSIGKFVELNYYQNDGIEKVWIARYSELEERS